MCACSVPQSCRTLCNPVDCSPPGSSVRRILQARILEWVATRDQTHISCLGKWILLPLSYQGSSGLPCPPPGWLIHTKA